MGGISAKMSGEEEMRCITKCPICGKPIYPIPADHDGHFHIIHKTPEEQIEELEQRVAHLEDMAEAADVKS
jgi:hypothetical protein